MLLLAPDKFKGTLTAAGAAAALARGCKKSGARVEIDRCPVADGGEGTLEILTDALHLEVRSCEVMGPDLAPVEACWGLAPPDPRGERALAVVQMSEASGLGLLPADRRDPLRTTTLGSGQLIAAAIESGARRIVVALGGSATCDGGAGLAQALGVRVHDRAGRWIEQPLAGGELALRMEGR
jgi:glycerate kinase